jgi:hypothetical protein
LQGGFGFLAEEPRKQVLVVGHRIGVAVAGGIP